MEIKYMVVWENSFGMKGFEIVSKYGLEELLYHLKRQHDKVSIRVFEINKEIGDLH